MKSQDTNDADESTALQIGLEEWPPRYDIQIETAYVVLGFLDEHFGAEVVKDNDRIDRFYPGEAALADTFENYLRRLQQEHGLSAPIMRKVHERGHITFFSQELTAVIDSYYTAHLDADQKQALEKDGAIRLPRGLPYAVFPQPSSFRLGPEDYNLRFSFLLGAYLRYGKGHSFGFSGAGGKADLIRTLLRDVGCPFVGWKGWFAGAPTKYAVEFEPTKDLSVLFGLAGDDAEGGRRRPCA